MNAFKILMIVTLISLGGSTVATTGPEMVSIPIEIPSAPPSPYKGGDWYIDHDITDEELYCMALNIYFEARGESVRGQYAVAEVVMDRVTNYNFPNSICAVVKQSKYHKWNPKIVVRNKCQFSWHCDGRPDRPVDFDAFATAMSIAKDVLRPDYHRQHPYSLYYHADYVKPNWADERLQVAVVDNHIFYSGAIDNDG